MANGALELLEGIPEGRWVVTEASQDYARNNISHEFLSIKQHEGLELLVRAVSMLQPGRPHTFSAAKYILGHKIAPHDDKMHHEVRMGSGSVVLHSRDIAVIWYLTKDWTEEDGGVLVDLQTGARYVPVFNSAVAFRVPRMHEVRPAPSRCAYRCCRSGERLESVL